MDPTIFNTGTISQTLRHLHEEGYHVPESALRFWVKSGQIPARYCGNRAYIYFPHVLQFLQGHIPNTDTSSVRDKPHQQ